MAALPSMDRAAAEQFLARVPWGRRMHIGMISQKGLVTTIPVQSVDEFLRVADGIPPYVMAEPLASWVRTDLCDTALAAALEEAAEGLPPFHQAAALVPLLRERRSQAEEVLRQTAGDDQSG